MNSEDKIPDKRFHCSNFSKVAPVCLHILVSVQALKTNVGNLTGKCKFENLSTNIFCLKS